MKNQFLKKNWWVFLLFIIALVIWSLVVVKFAYAKSGCCSWHGGVSGCDTSTGRQVCNDGTYSPSCTCAYIPPKPAYTPPAVTYSWNSQTYTSLDTYNSTKRSDIKSLCKKILEREPYSDSELDNWFNSSKDYKEIEQEFYNSEEYKKLQESKQTPTTTLIPTQITPTTATATTESESEDNSFWWWFVPVLALIGGIAYASHKKQE